MDSFEQQLQLEDEFFVPKLCESRALLSLVILTELFILIVILSESRLTEFDWQRFGLISLFSQWIVLLSAGLICWLHPYLARWRPLTAGVVCCLGVVGLTLLQTQLVFYVYTPLFINSESLFLSSVRFGLISFIIAALTLRYFYLISLWQQQKQTELRARLTALQARIQPHFLFNSLNSIASLIAVDPEKAEQAILDLSDLFRASLAHPDSLSTWQKELTLAKRYLSIEQYRLGERLSMRWQIETIPAELPIPHLTLQPLLENALIHGIHPLVEGGTIFVSAVIKDQHFNLMLINSCPINAIPSEGSQIALKNIQARLQAYFGESARLTAHQDGEQFTTTLSYAVTDWELNHD